MFKRLANIIKGFLSLFISGLEQANPQALIEAEKENLRKQIAQYNDNLASNAGFIERLMRQIKTLEQQEKQIAAKTAAFIQVNNRDAAGQLALQLQTIKQQLEENRAQLTAAEETYKKLVKSRDVAVKEATAKIEKLKQLISETKMLEAQAELQEMAAGMISSIGGSGDTLNRLEEYMSERRDKAAGRARVASSDIDISNVELKAAEQSALAAQALAEFESVYGFSQPSTSTETPPADAQSTKPIKEIGP